MKNHSEGNLANILWFLFAYYSFLAIGLFFLVFIFHFGDPKFREAPQTSFKIWGIALLAISIPTMVCKLLAFGLMNLKFHELSAKERICLFIIGAFVNALLTLSIGAFSFFSTLPEIWLLDIFLPKYLQRNTSSVKLQKTV